jgi:hypothetical protein
MRNPKKYRPVRARGMSVSGRMEGSEMWAKAVEKAKSAKPNGLTEPLLVDEDTASTMLGISPRFVWELGKKGILRVRRIGRRKLYLVSSLKVYAESRSEVA